MKIAALDLSLTATGVATSEGVATTLRPKTTGTVRLDDLEREVLRLVAGSRLVVLEGYSYGSRNTRAHSTGELGGVIRLGLWRARIGFTTVAPAGLKQYATSKGNAGKDAVLAEAIRRLGYMGSDNNEADALWMLQMALTHYGLPDAVPVPKAHLKGLEKVRWPDIGIPVPALATSESQPELGF